MHKGCADGTISTASPAMFRLALPPPALAELVGIVPELRPACARPLRRRAMARIRTKSSHIGGGRLTPW